VNHLSLFSGYEGFGLGLKLAGLPIRTVGYVEIDEYCQNILRARIKDGFLDWAPIIRDIRSADFRPMAGLVDIITAGVPCPWVSLAGKNRGTNPESEQNLWPDTLRVVRAVMPSYIVLENPTNITRYYFDRIRPELRTMGFDCTEKGLAAAEIGAPHYRDRFWVLATNSDKYRLAPAEVQERCHSQDSSQWWPRGLCALPFETSGLSRVPVLPNIRVVDGGSDRVGQLKAIGNGIVPAVVAEFLRRIA